MKKSIASIIIGFTCVIFTSALVSAQVKTDKPVEHTQVIVVGAGMSGLMSSVSLAGKGIGVILLEKEDIVGGRIYSPVFDGINCNLGTQYLFPGIHPVVDSYVKPLPTQPIDVNGFMWKGKFSKVSEKMEEIYPAPEDLGNEFTLAFEQLSVDWQLAGKGKEFFFDLEPDNDRWKALDKMNSKEYLANFPEAVYAFINAEIGPETGGNIEDLSAIVLVGWYGDDDPGKLLVKGGNQVLAEKIKDIFLKAGGQLYLNSEVIKVRQNGDSVEVECKDGRKFTSDYVVMSTPADITKDIVKGLPAEKIKALEAVDYSRIIELALHLKNFPTQKELPGVLFVGECLDGLINQTGPIVGEVAVGTIISICITDSEMLKLDDKQVVERTALVLKKISPEFNPESDILSHLIKRWEKGVSKWSPGFGAKYQKALRKPVGRIFFAGDYTGDPSLMGAAWSGTRSAEEVVNSIKKSL